MEDKQKLLLGITNCLLGSYIRIREIHWNTRNQATHNLTNTLMPELIDYIDSIIELMSGIMERPGYDILKPIIPSTKDLKPILQALVTKIETCQEMLTGPEYRGIMKTLDDLIADLNRWCYLADNF
jgi:DNA-binding ferritin-like protein